jgi:hypothetical protein
MIWQSMNWGRTYFVDDIEAASRDEVANELMRRIRNHAKRPENYRVETMTDQVDVYYLDRVVATYMP